MTVGDNGVPGRAGGVGAIVAGFSWSSPLMHAVNSGALSHRGSRQKTKMTELPMLHDLGIRTYPCYHLQRHMYILNYYRASADQ